ncbi:MAG: CHASE2 domain-containing protein, partial [Proteobacteria bacterium]|nr:CHASE2 domain-containing protein [Pseudomonadota bacterium]
MIAGGRGRAVGWALLGTLIIMVALVIAPRWGPVRTIQFQSFDLWSRHLNRTPGVTRDVVIIFIDQKSLDHFRCARGLGWPWPRDFYAVMVDFLHASRARVIVFDAVFSEPSVFQAEFGDDDALARAMNRAANVWQAAVFHRRTKGGCATEPGRLGLFARRRLKVREGGHRPGGLPSGVRHVDVTLPIAKLLGPAAGVGAINFQPDPDGVARRARLAYRFRDGWYPSLPLSVFGGLRRIESWRLGPDGLAGPKASIPLFRGFFWIKYYGAGGVFQAVSAVAVIQSALDLKRLVAGLSGPRPFDPVWAVATAPALAPDRVLDRMLPSTGPFDRILSRAAIKAARALRPHSRLTVSPSRFADKIVLIGASAAGLYDLRTTPLASAAPGVEIQATVLSNLLAGDFLRPAPPWVQAGLTAAVCLAAFLLSLLFASVAWGG